MRRRNILLGAVLVLAVVVLNVIGHSVDEPAGWGIDADERQELAAGGWRSAVVPLETLPVEGEQAAAEIAARISERYCGTSDTRRLEEHNTDHDYVMFVPACLDIDEPEHRLESPSALIEVHVGVLPQVYVSGDSRACAVNAGDQYDNQGICVRDLLEGA